MRKASLTAKSALFKLYKRVAEKPGGIIRIKDEVDEKYIEHFLVKSMETGRHRHKIKNENGTLETPIEMTWFNPA